MAEPCCTEIRALTQGKGRDLRAFGVLFVFRGIWEGVRNRKGCGCVWRFGVFGQRIRKGRGC